MKFLYAGMQVVADSRYTAYETQAVSRQRSDEERGKTDETYLALHEANCLGHLKDQDRFNSWNRRLPTSEALILPK